MLLSTVLAEINGGCFLVEGGHELGAGRISKGYVRIIKSQSESSCESQFLHVQTKTQPQSFHTNTEQAAFPNFS